MRVTQVKSLNNTGKIKRTTHFAKYNHDREELGRVRVEKLANTSIIDIYVESRAL